MAVGGVVVREVPTNLRIVGVSWIQERVEEA